MLKVLKKCCGECLFTKNKIVSDKRREQLLKEIEAKDSHFICHKASMQDKEAVCRGFYEKKTSNFIRISQRLGMIEFVDESAL